MCCTTCTVVLVLISRPGNPRFFCQLSQVYFKHCLKYIHYMVLFVYTYKSKVDFLSFKMVQVNMPCDAYRVWNRLEVLQLWRWQKTLWCHCLQFIVQCTCSMYYFLHNLGHSTCTEADAKPEVLPIFQVMEVLRSSQVV